MGERKAIAASVEELTRFAKSAQSGVTIQTRYFWNFGDWDAVEIACNFKLKEVSAATRLQCLQWEREFLGAVCFRASFARGYNISGKKPT